MGGNGWVFCLQEQLLGDPVSFLGSASIQFLVWRKIGCEFKLPNHSFSLFSFSLKEKTFVFLVAKRET
jgi:hypothetical protein